LGVRHALIIPSLEATDHSDACTGSGARTIIAVQQAEFAKQRWMPRTAVMKPNLRK
jgi:hypothetical protein